MRIASNELIGDIRSKLLKRVNYSNILQNDIKELINKEVTVAIESYVYEYIKSYMENNTMLSDMVQKQIDISVGYKIREEVKKELAQVYKSAIESL